MFEKIDSVRLCWSHGEGPDDKDVASLNEWLEEKWDKHVRIRFEVDSDGMTMFAERFD